MSRRDEPFDQSAAAAEPAAWPTSGCTKAWPPGSGRARSWLPACALAWLLGYGLAWALGYWLALGPS